MQINFDLINLINAWALTWTTTPDRSRPCSF